MEGPEGSHRHLGRANSAGPEAPLRGKMHNTLGRGLHQPTRIGRSEEGRIEAEKKPSIFNPIIGMAVFAGLTNVLEQLKTRLGRQVSIRNLSRQLL